MLLDAFFTGLIDFFILAKTEEDLLLEGLISGHDALHSTKHIFILTKILCASVLLTSYLPKLSWFNDAVVIGESHELCAGHKIDK